MKMESEVVENKGLPGNGLTDSVSPEEEPLRRSSNSSGVRGGGRKGRPRREISLVSGSGDGERGKGREAVVGFDDDDDHSGDEGDGCRKDKLEACAIKCRLTPKRALIYLVASSLVIFILLLAIIILAALWPSSPSQETCQSAQCHAYSAEILKNLNASAEPCQDVWEFSCGGWLQNNPMPASRAYWDVGLQQERTVKDKVRTLLNTLPTSALEESNSVLGKMKRFYDSCMATEYIEADNWKPLERIIKKLGGWNVLRDFRLTEFDFPRVLKKLHAEHRVSPFFHIEVVPDPRMPSRNIIKISPGGLSLPHKNYYFDLDNKVAESFKFHVKDMVQILSANSLSAQKFATELFSYEKRIAESSPFLEDLRDPVQTFHKVTVKELHSMSATIFWPDLLKAKFPKGNINDQTEVLVPSKNYLMDISGIISSTDKQTLNNYLMWHLAKKYLPYLSREYSEAYDMFLREISGRREALPRWEFCLDETLFYFRHAADYLLSENCEDRSVKVDKLKDLFDSIRQSLVNRINEETSKYDESLRNFFLDKLRLMQVHVGTPFQNGTLLKEFYMQMDVQKHEWFTNVHSAIEFQGKLEQSTLTNTQKEAPVVQLLGEHPNRVTFLPTSNQVIIPESFLQRKVLELGQSHLPLLMGSIGVEISEGISSAFGIQQGLYGSSGNLMSEKDVKTESIRNFIEQRRSCLVSFFTHIHLDVKEYLNMTSLDTTIHLAGLQLAAYTLENHDVRDIFLGLPALENLPPNALFFLSYVQSQCSVQTLLYQDLEHYSFSTLSHYQRTRGLLRQLSSFTDALQCPSSAELYADFSCGIVV